MHFCRTGNAPIKAVTHRCVNSGSHWGIQRRGSRPMLYETAWAVSIDWYRVVFLVKPFRETAVVEISVNYSPALYTRPIYEYASFFPSLVWLTRLPLQKTARDFAGRFREVRKNCNRGTQNDECRTLFPIFNVLPNILLTKTSNILKWCPSRGQVYLELFRFIGVTFTPKPTHRFI